MSIVSRINRTGLTTVQKKQLKNALADASKTVFVSSDQTLTQSSVAHQAVTELRVPVSQNKVYKFTAWVYATADATDGAQISFTGSTAANYIYGQFVTDGAAASAPVYTLVSAITTESDETEGTAAQVLVTATGVYSPSDHGYLQLAAAQAVSGATDTVIKKGSYLTVEEIF